MSTKSSRVNLILPVELEKKARENAYNLGMIHGGKGLLGPYIQLLAMRDMKNLPDTISIEAEGARYEDTIKVNITLDSKIREEMENKALELGFTKAGKGNLSSYIRYLIASE